MEYKTVAGPVALTIQKNENYANAVRQYADVIQRETVGGWRLLAIQETPVIKKPGCIGALTGRGCTALFFNMLIFCRGELSEAEFLNARRSYQQNAALRDTVIRQAVPGMGAAPSGTGATPSGMGATPSGMGAAPAAGAVRTGPAPSPNAAPAPGPAIRRPIGAADTASAPAADADGKRKKLIWIAAGAMAALLLVLVLFGGFPSCRARTVSAFPAAVAVPTPYIDPFYDPYEHEAFSDAAPDEEAFPEGDGWDDSIDDGMEGDTPVTDAPDETPAPSPSLSPTPTATPAVSDLEALVLEGAARYYTRDELETKTEYELSILRNGMFALSGKRFQRNQAVIDFFSACAWYVPLYDSDKETRQHMNDYQSANLSLIIEVEQEKGYR